LLSTISDLPNIFGAPRGRGKGQAARGPKADRTIAPGAASA
jgi:hypothetical protein